MNNEIKDEDIKRIMDSLETEIPEEVDIRVNEMIRHETVSRGSFRSFFTDMNPFIKWSPAVVSVILLMVLGFFQLRTDIPENKPMQEIRIEYEIKDKNIKILWVKKEEFLLPRRSE